MVTISQAHFVPDTWRWWSNGWSFRLQNKRSMVRIPLFQGQILRPWKRLFTLFPSLHVCVNGYQLWRQQYHDASSCQCSLLLWFLREDQLIFMLDAFNNAVFLEKVFATVLTIVYSSSDLNFRTENVVFFIICFVLVFCCCWVAFF